MNNYVDRLEHNLEKILSDTAIPAPLIRDAMRYSLRSGGKRIRPLLVYLGGELLNLPLEVLDILATAIELTHCYSLIHDDLPAMDNDDFRRGKPSCHKAFDEATAILAGDGLQALALEHLLTQLINFLPATVVVTVCRKLLAASGVQGMISGQSLDLSILSHTSVDEEQLRQIHQLKTGQLISACFDMVLAAAPDTTAAVQQSLRSFAAHLGLVFQMQDDFLDHYAAEVLGKKQSSDLANQKTTFATLYSREDLAQLVNDEFQLAYDALVIFGDKAKSLLSLTQQLHQRSKI